MMFPFTSSPRGPRCDRHERGALHARIRQELLHSGMFGYLSQLSYSHRFYQNSSIHCHLLCLKSPHFCSLCRYWAYKNRTLIKGPSNLSELNLPTTVHNMDAVVEWGANGHLYIFKGSMFWRYNGHKRSMDPGYPKTIQSVLPQLPSNLNAALQWKNGKTYFFKGTQYYSIDDASIRIRKGYPKSITTYWMGCSPEGLVGGKISPYRSSEGSKSNAFPNKAGFVLIASFVFVKLLLLQRNTWLLDHF